jgi:heat shock protein HslJ
MKSLFISFLLISACWLFACNSPSKTSTAIQSAPTTIGDIRWKLVELNGQAMQVQPPNGKEPYILFEEATNKVTGNGGCNGFGGTYLLQQDNSIRLSQLISTKMACNSLAIETRFMKALETTDRYEVVNDTLTFYKGEAAPMAKFVAAGKQ